MTSWASVAKRNIPSTATATATAQRTASPAPDIILVTPDLWAAASISESCDAHDKREQDALAREEQSQCRPTWFRLRRPDAPTVSPIFRTSEEQLQWMHDEAVKNDAYSKELFERRMQEWRMRNKWHLPPMKTTVSKYEQTRGFYIDKDDDKDVVKYVTPHSTARDLEEGTTANMLWCLIHSRADELVACKTVGEFEALFNQNIRLEYPDYNDRSCYGVRRIVNARKLLWLLSQKANVFPGKARHGTARWTTDPCMTCAPFDPAVYSKSMVFFSSRKCRDSKNAIVIGQHGGREETGICVVQQLKQNGDAATIRWLLSAKQLREMERVEFVSEWSPFREPIDYDSDCYGYYDDWL